MTDLVEEVARAIWEANSGAFAENNLSQEGMDALHREARAAIAVVIERCYKVAGDHRDGAAAWLTDETNNPTGDGYCCLKTSANIVGAIRKLGESE